LNQGWHPEVNNLPLEIEENYDGKGWNGNIELLNSVSYFKLI